MSTLDPSGIRAETEQVLERICDELLDLPTVPEAQWQPAPDWVRGGLVRIHGAWAGCVRVLCDDEMARALAAAMFRTSVETLVEADIDDAVRELANIVAGNIKPLLPSPSSLAAPESHDGRNGPRRAWLRVCMRVGSEYSLAVDLENATR